MGEQKRCCKCGDLLPMDEFYSSGHFADGVLPWCCDCDLEMLVLGTDEANKMMHDYAEDARKVMRGED